LGPRRSVPMRQLLRAAARAYVSALVWVLAGIGWGVLTGAALESLFGNGLDSLPAALDEVALASSLGGLVGAVASTIVMLCLHGLTLVPLAALLGKVAGRYPRGQVNLGITAERSARSGALVTVILAPCFGLTIGAMSGAGMSLETAYGHIGP